MTTALELLDDTYPHGTIIGYDRGCRGTHCGAIITCANVRMRYVGDWQFRKQMDAGWTIDDIAAADRAATEAERARVRDAARAARAKQVAPKVTSPDPERAREAEAQNAAAAAQREAQAAERTAATLASKAERLNARRERDARDRAERAAERAAARAERAALREAARAAERAARPDGMRRVAPREAVRNLNAQGFNDRAIAEQLKITAVRVGQIRRELGLAKAEGRSAGDPFVFHGTTAGYQTGCTDPTKCPKSSRGRTCTDAVAAAEDARRARAGEQHRAKHGTAAAYRRLGCRNPEKCPSAIAGGLSCREANTRERAAYRAEKRPRAAFRQLSDNEREAIRSMHAAGESDAAIGKSLGRSQSAISKARQRLGLPANFTGRRPR